MVSPSNALANFCIKFNMENTLFGGTSMPNLNVIESDDSMVLVLYQAGVKPESFKIKVEEDKLVIHSLLVQNINRKEGHSFIKGVAIPMLYRSYDIPDTVDVDLIHTHIVNNKVYINLPFKKLLY